MEKLSQVSLTSLQLDGDTSPLNEMEYNNIDKPRISSQSLQSSR